MVIEKAISIIEDALVLSGHKISGIDSALEICEAWSTIVQALKDKEANAEVYTAGTKEVEDENN